MTARGWPVQSGDRYSHVISTPTEDVGVYICEATTRHVPLPGVDGVSICILLFEGIDWWGSGSQLVVSMSLGQRRAVYYCRQPRKVSAHSIGSTPTEDSFFLLASHFSHACALGSRCSAEQRDRTLTPSRHQLMRSRERGALDDAQGLRRHVSLNALGKPRVSDKTSADTICRAHMDRNACPPVRPRFSRGLGWLCAGSVASLAGCWGREGVIKPAATLALRSVPRQALRLEHVRPWHSPASRARDSNSLDSRCKLMQPSSIAMTGRTSPAASTRPGPLAARRGEAREAPGLSVPATVHRRTHRSRRRRLLAAR